MLGRLRLLARIRQLEQDIAARVALEATSAHLITEWQRELHEARSQLSAHGEAHVPLPRYGVDYAWGRPSNTGLHQHGVSFVCRYLTGEGKAIDRAEALRLSGGGFALVAVFEQGARNAAGGAEQGARDGTDARIAMHRLGVPHGRPAYMAVDFDAAGEGQLPAVLAYLAAAHKQLLPDYRCGVYGGIDVVRAAFANGVTYGWQTLAWSRGQWSNRAQIRQTSTTGPTIEGVGCDTDWAYAADFGQWKL